MDLALNNLQRLICHKTQQTNQPTRQFLAILRSPVFGKWRMQPFVHLYIVLWLYTALLYRGSKSSNFLVFHISGSISLRSAAFLFLIFLSSTLSSSWVNCLSLMSSWLLIIFVIGLSITLGEFPRRFMKCSFPMCNRSSCLATFSLALEVLFLLLTFFTICLAIRDCITSTEFLILLIWHWMYFICSFWYALSSFLWVFSFWALVLVGFLLLYRDAVFTLSRFFWTTNVSHWNLCLVISDRNIFLQKSDMPHHLKRY